MYWNSIYPQEQEDFPASGYRKKYCDHAGEPVDWGFGPVHCKQCGRKGHWVADNGGRKIEWEPYSETNQEAY